MILSLTIQSTQTPRFASTRIYAAGRTSELIALYFEMDQYCENLRTALEKYNWIVFSLRQIRRFDLRILFVSLAKLKLCSYLKLRQRANCGAKRGLP